MSGTLFVVATPIGNLEDLSPRARQTLENVDLIAAEDTRHTGRLLSHFGIETRLLALHDHNEKEQSARLVEELVAGRSVAIVSDAGTPLVSDPGYHLVRAAHAAGIVVSPVPGPSAIVAALSAAGLPTDRFCFEGFLPAKHKARRDRLSRLAAETRTLVFYESVHRISECLDNMAAVFGADRTAFIGREVTKLHEECVHATLGELAARVRDRSIPSKGEFVVVVAGASDAAPATLDVGRLTTDLAALLPKREVARIVADATGGNRNEIYRQLVAYDATTEDG